MQVLFDNGVPRGVASVLKEHVVEEARDRGWDRLTNGDLLRAAEAAGFEILVTTDRNIRRQQNLCVIASVALGKSSWPLIKRKLPEIVAAISAAAELHGDRPRPVFTFLPTVLSCSNRWCGTARTPSQEPRTVPGRRKRPRYHEHLHNIVAAAVPAHG